MDIGEILTRAWHITWKHKALWLFGILASCGSQSGSSVSGSGYQSGGSEFGKSPKVYEDSIYRFISWFEAIPDEKKVWIFGGLIGFTLVLSLIFFALSTVGRVGLIKSTIQLENGQDALTIRQILQDSAPFLGRAFALNFLIGLVIFIFTLGAMLVGIFMALATYGIGLICLLPLFCLMIPVGWFLSLIIEQANIALVVEDTGVLDALSRGWQVVRSNIGHIFVIGIVLSIGLLILINVFNLPVLLIFMPTVIGFTSGHGSAMMNGLIISSICLVLYIPVLILLSGILQTYFHTSWTLTYLRLTAKPPTAGPMEALPSAI